MKILLVASSIIIPAIMLFLVRKSSIFNLLFNSVAVLSTLIFGGLASTNIYQIIADDAVFMTTIHGLFLNELFLATGAYVGVFVIFRLMKLTFEEK